MPTIKCPSCKKPGETGPPFGPSGSRGPDISVKPGNVAGSTKSLLYCRRCATPFLKGPIGRGKPVPSSMWSDFTEFMEREIAASDADMELYGRL